MRRIAECLDSSKSLYDRNQAVHGLLSYHLKVGPEARENTFAVWLVDWRDPPANDFGVAEEVTIPGAHVKASTKRPDVVLYAKSAERRP